MTSSLLESKHNWEHERYGVHIPVAISVGHVGHIWANNTFLELLTSAARRLVSETTDIRELI